MDDYRNPYPRGTGYDAYNDLVAHRHIDDNGCLYRACGCIWDWCWKTVVVIVLFIVILAVLF